MRLRNILTLGLFVFFAAGCDIFDESDPYPFEVLTQGDQSGYRNRIERVIQTQSEWQDFWQVHASFTPSPPPLPSANFNTSSIAAIYGGDQPTNGYSIHVVSVTKEDSDVLIRYRVQGSGVLTVITQPFIILQLPKPAGQIRFSRS